MMFSGVCFGCLSSIHTPLMRATLSKLVATNEQGRLMTCVRQYYHFKLDFLYNVLLKMLSYNAAIMIQVFKYVSFHIHFHMK